MGQSIRTIALGAALALGMAGLAGAQAPTTTSRGPAERAARADSGRGRIMKSGEQARRTPMQRAGRARRSAEGALLRGVQLTDAQKTQLKAVRERYHTRTAEVMRANRPDSAARAAMMRQRQAAQEQAARLREQELTEVRAILTPEQMKQFDANRAEMDRRVSELRERAARPGRGRVNGARGPRGDSGVRRGPGGQSR